MKHLSAILLVLSFSMGAIVAQDADPATAEKPIDPTATRELIRQWVQTERLLSEEKTTWQVEKSRMQELLDLYQKELTLLNEEISKAGTSAGTLDGRQETLKKEIKEYRDAQRLLADTLSRLLPRLQSMIPRLPQPLQDEILADSELLLSPDAMEKPRDVLKSMLAVMAASGRFNRSISVVEETRQLSGGKKMTVDVIYLGLARAYYASDAGHTAGVGKPGKEGWQWQEQADLAKEIRRAIAVYRKDSPPQLIQLPISLSDESSQK
jgi:hypothetical protein